MKKILISSLQQRNLRKLKRLIKIVNICRENPHTSEGPEKMQERFQERCNSYNIKTHKKLGLYSLSLSLSRRAKAPSLNVKFTTPSAI